MIGIIVLLLVVGFSGCLDTDEQEGVDKDKFVGKWRAIQFPFEHNKTWNNTWTFYEDNVVIIEYNWEDYGFNNSTVGGRNHYEIIGKKLIITNYNIPFNYSQNYDYKFSSDYNTLTLGEFSNDIYYVYKRIQ